MDEESVTLEDIFEEDNVFFVDTSLSNPGNTFLWDSYHARSYADLDITNLRKLMEQCQRFENMLVNGNCFTIKPVVDEIANLSNLLGNRIKWFNDRSNKLLKSKKALKRNYSDKFSDAREDLQSLHDLVWGTKQLANKSTITFNDEFYYRVVEIYKAFTTAIPNLKRDISYQVYGQLTKKKFSDEVINENDTDERLAAAVIYETLFQDKPVSLLTADGHFTSLLSVVPRLLASDSFLPYNEEFRRRLVSNPYSLYFFHEEKGWVKKYDSSNFWEWHNEEFEIYSISEGQSEDFKEVIELFWKKFDLQKVQSQTG